MKAMVVTPKNQSEYKFLYDLLKKFGIMSATMSEEELEDLGLAKLITLVESVDNLHEIVCK